MKKLYLIIALAIFLFVNFVSAALVENLAWQQNLTGSSYNNGAVFGDLDNDGDLDLISIGCDSGSPICTVADKSYVYINNGTSLVENIIWEQNLSEEGMGSIALGDIDNDGDLDLILTGGYASVTKIYTNNGTSFTENSTWQSEVIGENGAASNSVALGDIDNDGDLDIIFSGMVSNRVVYINNGTSFVNESKWNQVITDEEKVSTGLIDFDNDGDLDLNIMGYDSAKGYVNNGTGFVPNANWNMISSDEGSIVWGDLDNDGDFDGIQSRWGGVLFSINNGSALLSDSSWNDDLTGLAFGSLAFGDYDNNGYLDLASAGSSGGTNYLQVASNNGSYFERTSDAEANLTGEQDSSVILGDIDNDNDLDLIVIRSRKVYLSNISLTTPNTIPTLPSDFSNSYSNREIKLGWSNGSDAETPSTGLYYNLMIGTATANHTIISGVYGGSGDATRGGTAFGYFGNMMQRKNFTLKVDRLQPSTNYTWYVQTIDTGLKAGNWSAVQTFITPADMTRPNITLNAPVNYYNSSSYTITFNATVFDNMNLSNVSLWGNWSGEWHLNETNSSGINNTDYIFTKDLTSNGDGTYTWQILARDNVSNTQNSSIRTFTIDGTAPDINITSPINNTNLTNNQLHINYTFSDINLQACWYSNDTMSVNTTLTCGQNITTITWAEGQHNLTVWANDSFGNINLSSIVFTIDSINPNINITSPINSTTSTDNTLDINYTASDINLQACWYSNDTYSINTTFSNCTTNITTITWAEGQHNVTVWANDSFGNINSSSIMFRIDTVAPDLNITSPINNTNLTDNTLDIEYTVSDANLQMCWYSNDTYTVNTTITNCANITDIVWTEGQHNVTVWANDSANNKSLSSVTFTIDSINPNINITSPINSTYSTDNTLDINYTASDINLQACWYSNDTYSINTTFANCTTNITTVTWADGQHNITVWANDSFGNINSSRITFTVDTTYPVINLISPANALTWTSSSTVTFSYNVTDTDIANCSLIISGNIDQTNTSVDEDTSQTFSTSMSNAVYTWNINCTDYVDYTNTSETRTLTVSYTAPTNGGGGGGGSSTTTTPVTPTPKEFDIDFSTSSLGTLEAKQGEIKTFTFNNQIKHSITLMTITADSMTLLITSDPITIQIKLGETKQIDINEDEINDFEIKLDSIISGKAKFSLTKLEGADIIAEEEIQEVIEKEALFDVKVSIVNLFKIVKSGRDVISEIQVFNVNNIGQVDVVVDYYLTSREDNMTKLAQGSDTLAVEAVASFVRSLKVPYNIKSGNYLFNVDIKYQDKLMASSSAEFRVIKNYVIILAVGIIILIIGAIFFYLWRIKKKEEKDVGKLKREIGKLENKGKKKRRKK